MACSKYEYVKEYQNHPTALLQTYNVVRIDGRGFTKFCNAHHFRKPNDLRAIDLMNQAALYVVEKFQDIFMAYGQSDQYSFVLSKDSQLFNRRIDKIETCLVSAFTSAYVFNWPKFFKDTPLTELPSFDARIIQYPNLEIVKDYFRWRQVDCHINNLYNTTFWCMVNKGMKNTEVENKLKDTNSGEKNEILFSQFNINYNEIEDIYRKGTIICYKYSDQEKQQQGKMKSTPKIVKQLITSIREIQEACENTEKIVNKLSKSEIKEDLEVSTEFSALKDDLLKIKTKYEQIDLKMKERVKFPAKQKAKKIQLKKVYEDLIKEKFWESIKIE